MIGETPMETYDRIEAEIAARRGHLGPGADAELRRALVSALGLGEDEPPTPSAERIGICRRGDILIERLRIELENPVPAHLYLPAERRRPGPAVLLAPDHESGGKSDRQYFLMGQILASRGISALIPDPIGVGERAAMGHSDPKAGWLMLGLGPGLFGAQLAELRALAKYLACREDISSEDRVGCAGHGTGGMLALFLGALCRGLNAVAASGFPGTFQFLASAERRLCPCSIVPRVLSLAEVEDVLALAAPKPVLLMGGLNDGRAPEQLAWRILQRARDAYARRGADPNAVRLFVSPHERELDHGRRLAAAEFFAAVFGLKFSGRLPAPMRIPPDGCLGRRGARLAGTLLDMVERRLSLAPRSISRRISAEWRRVHTPYDAANGEKGPHRRQGGCGKDRPPREGGGAAGRDRAATCDQLRRFVVGLTASLRDRAVISMQPPDGAGPFDVGTALGCARMTFKPGKGAPILVLGDASVPVGTRRPLATWRFPAGRILAMGVPESLVAAQRGAFLGVPPAALSAAILSGVARSLGGNAKIVAKGADGVLALYAAFASRDISGLEWEDAPCSFKHLPNGRPDLFLPGILALGDLPDLCAALAGEIELSVDWARTYRR